MPPRITIDPTVELCPVFSAAAFAAVCQSIAANGNTTAQLAAEQLEAAWKTQNAVDRAAWDAQCATDTQEAQEQHDAERKAQETARDLLRKQAETEQREKDKKKPKINDFDENLTIGDEIPRRPSAYALQRLDHLDYVELWYFCPQGLQESADANQNPTDSIAFGFTTGADGEMGFKPANTEKASRSVVRDRDLTWRQMTMGKTAMLMQMTARGWPEKHIRALATFYVNLDIHPYRDRPNGEEILLLYQARARREFFDSLKLERGFNIAPINAELLRSIADEYRDNMRANQVSLTPPPLATKATANRLLLPPPPPSPTRFASLRFLLHASRPVLHASHRALHTLLHPSDASLLPHAATLRFTTERWPLPPRHAVG